MRRLNGRSAPGSKPMTTLSFPLSWMPHCWPQKQQCVLTNFSGSDVVERLAPAMRDRCGPNWLMIFSSSTGRVAMAWGILVERELLLRVNRVVQVHLEQHGGWDVGKYVVPHARGEDEEP